MALRELQALAADADLGGAGGVTPASVLAGGFAHALSRRMRSNGSAALSYDRRMALELDTSRSFRSLDELTALVRAISRAPATESEPDWLEWKREADLSDRRWQAVIAKCIAGFANRDPAVAKRQADGCAYLVIGVEPGNLGGVSPVDNAMLHSGISRFLGPTVRWSPQYIEHVGKRVLIITVEAPAYGDRIVAMLVAYEPLQRGTSVCRKGDVFVRRHGSTDRATQEDYDALTRRFATGTEQSTGFRIEVMAPVTAVPVTCRPDEVLAWRQEEEQQLLAQFEEDSSATQHVRCCRRPVGIGAETIIGARLQLTLRTRLPISLAWRTPARSRTGLPACNSF